MFETLPERKGRDEDDHSSHHLDLNKNICRLHADDGDRSGRDSDAGGRPDVARNLF